MGVPLDFPDRPLRLHSPPLALEPPQPAVRARPALLLTISSGGRWWLRAPVSLWNKTTSETLSGALLGSEEST